MDLNIITNLQLKLNLEKEERERDEEADIQRIKDEIQQRS